MKTIKTFIENFLQAEAETTFLMRQPNLENYNNALEKMNAYCVESLQNKFGLIPLTELDEPEYYEKWSAKKHPNPRHIYKISQYQNETYNDVYVVYVSEKNPDDEIFQYGWSLFVTSLKDELKIIRNYSLGDAMRVKDKFEVGQGVTDISFKTLKKPISIERYQKPEDDDDAMEHYEMDV
ncbi:hypothetical protein [Chryseobacterium sp. R2A-55]|uniref:hypothetical protein n=1 Tax=Chryseobacterium sp. R2A-55 TaxID=2744445 RepID=UPI001F4608FB|nr:hypothetical protein [Chryseobacterium sp. R2A-55]